MKLLFDARWINNDSPDGITRYSTELIKQLLKSDEINLWLLISSKNQLDSFGNAQHILTNPPKSHKELGQARRLNKYNFDVVYSPNYLFGGGGRKFRLVRTVHDLIPFYYKAKGASIPWRVFHANLILLKRIISNSERIVTVSQTVKEELQKLTRCRVEVVYNAPSEIKIHNDSKGDYIMYIGRYEHYKNVECIIEAMEYLPKYKLKLCGGVSQQRKNELLSHAKKQSQIEFMGKISDSQYSKLLSGALAMVSASKQEGFGLPIIEAMGAGCPVVCSDTPIFREVAGSAGLFFDFNNPKALADRIIKLENDAYRKKIQKKCYENASKYSWTSSGNKLKLLLLDVSKKTS